MSVNLMKGYDMGLNYIIQGTKCIIYLRNGVLTLLNTKKLIHTWGIIN